MRLYFFDVYADGAIADEEGMGALHLGRSRRSRPCAERAGFSSLAEGAKVSYEIVSDRGKESAGNLRL